MAAGLGGGEADGSTAAGLPSRLGADGLDVQFANAFLRVDAV